MHRRFRARASPRRSSKDWGWSPAVERPNRLLPRPWRTSARRPTSRGVGPPRAARRRGAAERTADSDRAARVDGPHPLSARASDASCALVRRRRAPSEAIEGGHRCLDTGRARRSMRARSRRSSLVPRRRFFQNLQKIGTEPLHERLGARQGVLRPRAGVRAHRDSPDLAPSATTRSNATTNSTLPGRDGGAVHFEQFARLTRRVFVVPQDADDAFEERLHAEMPVYQRLGGVILRSRQRRSKLHKTRRPADLRPSCLP